ncbi:hypothetical protein [Actinoallomurus iriomotensis]|nr:hypothetical protein [Actinoallomurus iriomotensis]
MDSSEAVYCSERQPPSGPGSTATLRLPRFPSATATTPQVRDPPVRAPDGAEAERRRLRYSVGLDVFVTALAHPCSRLGETLRSRHTCQESQICEAAHRSRRRCCTAIREL